MAKLSSYTAAVNLIGSSFPIIQGGANRLAAVSVLDSRWGVYQAAVDPTNGDDSDDGFVVGQRWLNTVSLNEFICVQATVGSAIWRHIPRVLGTSGAALSCDGTTNENTLVSITLRAGSMGPNGALRVKTLWSFTNSGNSKNLRVRLGGTAFLDATQSANATYQDRREIHNRNSQSSQVGWAAAATAGGGGASASAATTAAIDTSAATTLAITGQKASAGETLTLESYLVELYRPDIT